MSLKRWCLTVFIVALAVRLAFVVGQIGLETPPRDDAAQYDAIARSLASGGAYVTGEGYRSNRAPAFPVFLAGVYRLFGADWARGRLTQVVISASTCPLILVLGAESVTPLVGILAAFGYALFPYGIFWSGYLLSEPLCTLFVTAAMIGLLGARRGAGRAVLFGVFCGLAALTRPNMGSMLVLGLLWVFAGRPRPFRQAGLALAVFALTILPWTWRNYSLYHRFVPITTMGGLVLWEGNNPYVANDPGLVGRSLHAASTPEGRDLAGLSEEEADRRYFHLAVDFMIAHPWQLPRLVAVKVGRLWNPWPNLESRMQTLIAAVSIVPTTLLLLLGLATAWRRREGGILLLTFPLLAVTLTAAIYWGDARIRAPADPEVLLIAAYGAEPIVRRCVAFRNRRRALI